MNAFDLLGQDLGHRHQGAIGDCATEHRRVAVDVDAKAAGVEKVGIEKRELEQRLARKRDILRRKRKAAEINGGDTDGRDALDEGVFGIEKRLPQRAGLSDGTRAFQGRRKKTGRFRHRFSPGSVLRSICKSHAVFPYWDCSWLDNCILNSKQYNLIDQK